MVFFFFFLFWRGWLTPRSLTAGDKVGDCDMMKWLYLSCKRSAGWLRETYEHLLSRYLTTFFFPPFLCVSCTHAAGACAERGKVFLQLTPLMKYRHCVVWNCGRLQTGKFCPPGVSLSTVSHRALTSEDRDFFSHGAPFTTKPSADKLWLLSLWTASVTSQTVMLHILTFPRRIWGTWTPSVCVHCVTAPPLSEGMAPRICIFGLCFLTLRFYSDIYRKCGDAIWHANGGIKFSVLREKILPPISQCHTLQRHRPVRIELRP